MKHELVERFIAAFVIKEDETDDDACVGEWFHLAIEIFEGAFVDREIAVGTVRRKGEELGEIDVEGGVFDTKGESVIDHLDLEPLLGWGEWERGGGLCVGGKDGKNYTDGTKEWAPGLAKRSSSDRRKYILEVLGWARYSSGFSGNKKSRKFQK